MNLDYLNLFLTVELSSWAFYTQCQFSLCMLCFQKCQRRFFSLWRFLYFSTETTCPIFMNPFPHLIQGQSHGWLFLLLAGPSSEKWGGIMLCVCVCLSVLVCLRS